MVRAAAGAVLIVSFLTAPVAGARTGCFNADRPAITSSIAVARGAVLCLINQRRGAHHLAVVHENRLLDRSAQEWTAHMVRTGEFTHGSNFAGRVSAVGYDWSAAGENIATGFETPRQVVAAWMASADHCQNILDPDYVDVGTGVIAAPVGRWASGPSTWTQDFGLPMDRPMPTQNWGPADGCPY